MQKLGFAVFQTDAIATQVMYSDAFMHGLDDVVISKIAGDDKKIDRKALLRAFIEKQDVFEVVEKALHPIVQSIRSAWTHDQLYIHGRSAVLEIPLFFEKTLQLRPHEYTNAIVIASVCGMEMQRKRARTRANFVSEEVIHHILMRQCNDDTRMGRSNVTIHTCGNKLYVKDTIKKLIYYGTKYRSFQRNST